MGFKINAIRRVRSFLSALASSPPILESRNRRSIPGPTVVTQELADASGNWNDRRVRANVYPFYA